MIPTPSLSEPTGYSRVRAGVRPYCCSNPWRCRVHTWWGSAGCIKGLHGYTVSYSPRKETKIHSTTTLENIIFSYTRLPVYHTYIKPSKWPTLPKPPRANTLVSKMNSAPTTGSATLQQSIVYVAHGSGFESIDWHNLAPYPWTRLVRWPAGYKAL